ncbi:MAG TPA: DotA/TraY family protein [Micavibrio sp.]
MRAETKKVMGFVLLPQITPRLHKLFGSGFAFLALMVAQVFASVGLLPRTHPYLRAANHGRFSTRHVLFEAWRHLKFDRQHIDQVLIFFVIAAGLLVLVLQIFMLLFGVFGMTAAMALAMPAYFDTMLITPNPIDDIAFIMLDRTFGLPDIYGSCVSVGVPCFAGTPYNPQNIVVDLMFPSPFHEAFHQFLSVYSYGLLVVAAIVICYLVVNIIAETAHTGTPFGRRFNHVWAPLRLVIALGLLIPMDSGLNSAQYIVLYSAKFGSGFATNGWNMFLGGAGLPGTGTLLGEPDTLVGAPEAPPVSSLLQFGTSLAACIRTQRFFYGRDINAYVVNPAGIDATSSRRLLTDLADYTAALEFENYNDIYFVFGAYEEGENGRPLHSKYPGAVAPYCGELVLQISDVNDAYSPGSRAVLTNYYSLVRDILWEDAVADGPMWGGLSFGQVGTNAARKYIASYPSYDSTIEIADADELIEVGVQYEDFIRDTIDAGVEAQINAPGWTELDDFGWAGAGIWYNKVAELNGMLIGAVNALPMVRKFPMTMEEVKKERSKYDQDSSGLDMYEPRRADGTRINMQQASGYDEAVVQYAAYKVWGEKMSSAQPTANALFDAIHVIFGTKGLFNMARNTDIHPLAQLVAVGKSLVESSIRNLGASFMSGVGAGIANLLSAHPGAANFATMASKLTGKIAMVGITAGFMLFYLLPFLPFMYFFFAVGMWVKTVLEAMVGTPLWALAHLRIDGDGLPGASAIAGYYLILEVFLRPIMTVFGLLGSVVIFGAQVKILHEIWPLVVSNVSGFDADMKAPPAVNELGGLDFFRGLIDQFLFTVMYCFVVYMMAMASFKMIDLVPDHVMRWMGAGVQSFGGIVRDEVADTPKRLVLGMGAASHSLGSIGGQIGDGTRGMNKALKAQSGGGS